MLTREHWIPPATLLYAQAAHGFSWALLFWVVRSANLGNFFYSLAWIHTVALAWITMAALGILIHAMPNFIDVRWRGERLARWSLGGYGAGVVLLIYGFMRSPSLLALTGTIVVISLLVYLTTAFATIAGAMRGERTQRAIARAFAATFTFLIATAAIGIGLAAMLSGRPVPSLVAALPAAHADLGTLGWLSLLVFGISMRTLRPIAGGATRFWWMHIVVASASLLGVPTLAVGVAAQIPTLAWIGGALFACAALGYAFDVFDIIRRGRNRHRPPQAFLIAGICWFLISLAIGAGVLTGRPWQQAYGFVLLMGFVGQFVNAHLYHIGIRLLATYYRGDEGETRPQELLAGQLSWLSFVLLQTAVALATGGLIVRIDHLVAAGAVLGSAGWIAMLGNMLIARQRASKCERTGKRGTQPSETGRSADGLLA